ncbi:MAG TPA: hypothetical protein VLT62_23700 [Candidatus Methylomirabilis sp.]|nr:hypothetical protein [Candidatus Methylomirabilis sp.]
MKTIAVACVVGAMLGAGLLTGPVLGQQAPPMRGPQIRHDPLMRQAPSGQTAVPTLPGQDAFGAIQEVVRILEADPATDWTKVNLERLRQHLIDMNEVTLQSVVKSEAAPGGLTMEVTGAGRVEQAIRRMVVPHAAELNRMPEWSATTVEIPGGLRLTVTAKNPNDARSVGRIRGLGFIGLLVQGAHHQPHHLTMAKGEAMVGHGH